MNVCHSISVTLQEANLLVLLNFLHNCQAGLTIVQYKLFLQALSASEAFRGHQTSILPSVYTYVHVCVCVLQ